MNEFFDIESVLYENAFNSRRIYLVGELTSEVTTGILEQLYIHAEDMAKPVYLMIHSPGGDMDVMDAIIDEMAVLQEAGLTISTVAVGMAYSAAADILAMGSKGFRHARRNANIMLHPSSYGMSHDYSGFQERLTDFIKMKNHLINEMVAVAVGKDKTSFEKDIDKGLWLTASQAVDYGIVDSVLTSPVGVKGDKDKDKEKTNQQRRIRSGPKK